MIVSELLKETEAKMQEIVDGRKRELASVRTGRATPTLLDAVNVECYGATSPLKQIANISVTEGRTLVIQPWDKGLMSVVEKALQVTDLGANPQSDGTVFRITLPPLSEERRKDLVKLAKKFGEEGKVALRNVRHDANKKIDKAQKDEDLPKDDAKKAQDKTQKMIGDFNKKIDEVIAHKEEEILNF
jgi:ribosome recycling factor